jgi:sarcosine reductase
MRLELAKFHVKDVRFANTTFYSDGVLEINKEELTALVLRDNRIEYADLDVAFPNEKTRIVFIRDVVEPRIKISGPGSVFPGINGPVETVGEGRTHTMSGITVMTSAQYRPTILSGTAAQTSGILDMWGPGAQVTPFGATTNVTLFLKLVDGVTELEAHSSIQRAEFNIANRLAETTRQKNPDDIEIFELFRVDSSLPRIVYILGCLTQWHSPHSFVAIYGLPIRESLPTFIHPNEFLDGALTTDARRGNGGFTTTWGWMNHPLVLQLLREHGKRINFLGVILQRTEFEAEQGKQVTAAVASQMARLLKAEGAILSRTVPGGLSFIEVMLTLQACERKGIKTVLLTPEWGGTDGTELPLVFYVPEATAMVSTGSQERDIKLPSPNKVIGARDKQLVAPRPGDKPFSPWDEVVLEGWRDIIGGLDWWGGMNFTCKEY